MIMKINYPFCHHRPERTFKIGEYYFPVCSRCTGLYLGFLTSSIFLYLSNITYINILTIFLMLIPCSIDGGSQYLGLRESNNYLRFLTGIIAGIGLGMLLILISGM
jgi:uncharacterized membrane protein